MYIIYFYGRSRQTSIDDDNGLLDPVGRHAVGPVTIGQVVRTVVARLAHCVVPFHFEPVLARFGRFAGPTFSPARVRVHRHGPAVRRQGGRRSGTARDANEHGGERRGRHAVLYGRCSHLAASVFISFVRTAQGRALGVTVSGSLFLNRTKPIIWTHYNQRYCTIRCYGYYGSTRVERCHKWSIERESRRKTDDKTLRPGTVKPVPLNCARSSRGRVQWGHFAFTRSSEAHCEFVLLYSCIRFTRFPRNFWPEHLLRSSTSVEVDDCTFCSVGTRGPERSFLLEGVGRARRNGIKTLDTRISDKFKSAKLCTYRRVVTK